MRAPSRAQGANSLFLGACLYGLATGGAMGAAAGWYVVQVQAGREGAVCELIKRVASEGADESGPRLLAECFTPRFVTRRKCRGEWRDMQKLLFPGYVIAVTGRPEELALRMREVPEFALLLSMGETFVPLREDERVWMEELAEDGDRTVALSTAVKDGDSIRVTEGPLRGREGIIKKVNRHKCLAHLEVSIAGKRVTTTVGLAVLPKEDGSEA